MDNAVFKKTTLPSGLRILTERHPHIHSATIGVWINAGSVYETEEQRGMAHLLEHMVFKGTERRSMQQIAIAMDSIGGQMNAFTEREFVCYHAKVLAEHTDLATELLCDLVTSPVLAAADLALEKGVILEEIKAVEDTPEDLIEELFTQTIWERSRWGYSILGTPESVTKLTARDVRGFMKQHYQPSQVVLAAVGDIEHEHIVELASKLMSKLPGKGNLPATRQPRAPRIAAHTVHETRDIEQVHICCGTKSYNYNDSKRFAAWILDTVLTAGYSSRLFQEVREKRGLCYNIGPLSACYRNAAFWAVETSTAPVTAPKVMDLISRELKKIKRGGITKTELKRAQQMSRANLLLSEESSSAQMGRLARNELYYGRQRTTQELLKEIEVVTQDQVGEIAIEMFDAGTMNLAAIGPDEKQLAALSVEVD